MRSGVQLKDKWRNLVKFRHLSQEDAQTLQPKTSGPWHRRHLAAAGGGASGSDGCGARTGAAGGALRCVFEWRRVQLFMKSGH
jgi:hypothetical protein